MALVLVQESGNNLTNFANLQAALNAANAGDIIELDKGMICDPTGGSATQLLGIRIPCLNLASPVTVTTSGIAALPVGKRVAPSQVANMASIYGASNSDGATLPTNLSGAMYAGIDIARPANNFTFQGLNIRVNPGGAAILPTLLSVGSNSVNQWQIRFSGVTGGTFTLTYNGQTTNPAIQWVTDVVQLRINMAAALNALTPPAAGALGGLNIGTIDANNHYFIFYDAPVSLFTVNGAGLTGSSPTAALYSGGGTYHGTVVDGFTISSPNMQSAGLTAPLSSYKAEVPQGGDHCPHDIIFDRCLLWSGITGPNGQQIKLGIYMNGNNCTIENCYIYDIKRNDNEAHAFQMTQTQSGTRFFFINNYAEASTENFFVGGDAPWNFAVPGGTAAGDGSFGLTPFLVQYNLFVKPLAYNPLDPTYDGSNWWVKNIFELKNGHDWLIDNNTFQNSWAGRDQRGHAVLFTPRGTGSGSQGKSNDTVYNIHFTNNHILNCLCGFNIAGSDDMGGSDRCRDVLIQDTLLENMWDHANNGLVLNTKTFDGETDNLTNGGPGAVTFHPGRMTGYSYNKAFFSIDIGSIVIANFTGGAGGGYLGQGVAIPPGQAERLTVTSILITKQYIWGVTPTGNPAYDSNGQPIAMLQATGGTFKFSYNGNNSADVPYNDSVGNMQTALQAVTGLSAATISGGTLPGNFIIIDLTNTPGGGIGHYISIDNTNLQGGAAAYYGNFLAFGTFVATTALNYNCTITQGRMDYGILEGETASWMLSLQAGILPVTNNGDVTTSNITFNHNTLTTIRTNYSFVITVGTNDNKKHHNFMFTNNVMQAGNQGFQTTGITGTGLVALQAAFDMPSGGTFLNNAIYGKDLATGTSYGAGYLAALPDTTNFYETQAVGTAFFTNWNGGKNGTYSIASGHWINSSSDSGNRGARNFVWSTDGNGPPAGGGQVTPTWNRINFCGFETGDASEVISSAGGSQSALFGTASIVTTPVNGASVYALRVNPTTIGTGGCALVAPDSVGLGITPYNVATAFHRFYFQWKILPASGDEEICFFYDTPGAAHKGSIRINSAGNLVAYAADDATVLATGATALVGNVWYRIEVKWGTGASGPWEVKINGVSEISGTGSLGTSNNGWFGIGKLHNRNGNTVDFYYDDIAIDSLQYPGAGNVVCVHPNANGMYNQWQLNDGPNYFAQVNEVLVDGDTTYVKDATLNDVFTVKFTTVESVGLSGQTMYAVKVCCIAKDDSGGLSQVGVRIRSGMQNTDSGICAVGKLSTTIYTLVCMLDNIDPATGFAWTVSGLDAVEAGMINGASHTTRLSYVSLMIDFAQAGSPVLQQLLSQTDKTRVPVVFGKLPL